MALEMATQKPLCRTTCSSSGKLADFLDHPNGVHENIQFTMDTERDGTYPSFTLIYTIKLMAQWAI
jgi:hypothetical protein